MHQITQRRRSRMKSELSTQTSRRSFWCDFIFGVISCICVIYLVKLTFLQCIPEIKDSPVHTTVTVKARFKQPPKRPKYLVDELNGIQPVFVALFKKITDTSLLIGNVEPSWLHDIYQDYVKKYGFNKKPKFRDILDHPYPSKHVAITTLCRNYSNHYQWFLLLENTTYVKVPVLLNYLHQYSPSQDILLGHYSRSEYSERENNLVAVVLSRQLLVNYCPHVQHCPGNNLYSFISCVRDYSNATLRQIHKFQVAPSRTDSITMSSHWRSSLVNDDIIGFNRVTSSTHMSIIHHAYRTLRLQQTLLKLHTECKELLSIHPISNQENKTTAIEYCKTLMQSQRQ